MAENTTLSLWEQVFAHQHFSKVWKANKMQGGHWHIELCADPETSTPAWEWKFSAKTMKDCVNAAASFISWLKEG